MQKSFLGVKARPGEVVYGSFNVADVPIPLIVVAGRWPGKTLVIHCAQHATEYSGSAMIGPLLAELDPATMRGTLVIVPLSNLPHIARLRLPQLYQSAADSNKPYENTIKFNINRCWPGRKDGTFNDRLTWTLSHELFAHADAVIDYHSCRMCDPDFTQYVKGRRACRELAIAFGFAVIDESRPKGDFPGQLHVQVPRAIGTPAILVEMSPTSERVLWSAVCEAKRGAL
ncbi:MAG: succinylglutamate desuccinylase/aspartoacylase family protein, partial [Phycisphaerae bacterium]|nr:succinylglutamate desuccinylase/aspartoacylase family protein [Phycisphaerae bacterium]